MTNEQLTAIRNEIIDVGYAIDALTERFPDKHKTYVLNLLIAIENFVKSPAFENCGDAETVPNVKINFWKIFK